MLRLSKADRNNDCAPVNHESVLSTLFQQKTFLMVMAWKRTTLPTIVKVTSLLVEAAVTVEMFKPGVENSCGF